MASREASEAQSRGNDAPEDYVFHAKSAEDSSFIYDVLVVGAGPAGLMLAYVTGL